MIKRSFVTFALTAFVLIPSMVKADQGDFSLGADIGNVGLVGSGMGTYGSNGFGFGGYLSYAASDLFDLDMNLLYSPHSNGANSANAFYGTLALKFGMAFDQLLPYLTTGIGIYRNSVVLGGVSDSVASFGFNVGGGMDVDVGSMLRIGLLVRYHPVFGKTISTGANGMGSFWDALFRIGILFKTGVQGGWD
ncbi:MAG: outer membrane beta-barrel protein [Pseudomonadota bacterium]